MVPCLDSEKYPPLSSLAEFEWYNPDARVVICPLRARWDNERIDLIIKQLEQLGGEITGEISMPLDLGHHFLYYKLPDWLTFEEDEEAPEILEFKDNKGRSRLRIITSLIMLRTVVFTRYRADWFRSTVPLHVSPIVRDNEKCDEDEYENDADIIWVGEEPKDLMTNEIQHLAEDWLDKEFPDWRNPRAYWTE